MKAIRLIAASDEYNSSKAGFIIKGTPAFDELMADHTGLLTAHDLLEHQNGMAPMGTVWDELEALGGIWYIRGQHGDMMTDYPNYHSPAVNVASDVTRMFSEYSRDPYNGPGGLGVGSRPHDYDDDFREIIEIARRDIPREHNDMGPELHAIFDEYLTLALYRMRAGYRKAERRFTRDGASDWNGYNLFRAVKEAVKSAVSHIDFEGQEFILRYGNGEATCRPAYDEHYW